MITLKVRLCPFNSEPIVMKKDIKTDVVPQLGSNILQGEYRFRVALAELDLATMATTVILSDFKAPKHPIEDMFNNLAELGWVLASPKKEKKDD